MPTPATLAEATDPDHRPYEPIGSALQLLRYRGTEVLISGSAGTGKSTAALTKLHACCEKYPGCRAMMVRKTRVSLTESALVTFEEKVVPVGHAILPGAGHASQASRASRQAYRYPNGSTIVCAGLDRPGKIFSTEWDLVYVQEAVEFAEDAWEALTTRLRNGALPYQQILADTNPDAPTHWLKLRCDAGKTLLIESRHEDNPLLFQGGRWTPFGLSYLAKLDALTGPRKQRLRHGRWVQAEGVVYEGWDARVHLIDRFAVSSTWPRIWLVDFGYSNPFVWQDWRLDGDGRAYLVREIYLSQRLVEDHARRILHLTAGEPAPIAVVCDHDAEGRATLERHLKMRTTSARKAVREGIQVVAARLRPAGDGKPRLFIMRDALDQRDPQLVEAKKPSCTAEEWDSYVWDRGSNRKLGEEPVKLHDHGMDCVRYLCAHLDMPRRVGGAVGHGGRQ